jgi:hypothetical protein
LLFDNTPRWLRVFFGSAFPPVDDETHEMLDRAWLGASVPQTELRSIAQKQGHDFWLHRHGMRPIGSGGRFRTAHSGFVATGRNENSRGAVSSTIFFRTKNY